jgi:hypothetical protein
MMAEFSQQRGFWRSPRGESHGLNSKPGDEWVHEGDIHDTDRLQWLVDNITEEIAVMMPDDFGQARQYIDELMLANADLRQDADSERGT